MHFQMSTATRFQNATKVLDRFHYLLTFSFLRDKFPKLYAVDKKTNKVNANLVWLKVVISKDL